jgi:hypothetical protein
MSTIAVSSIIAVSMVVRCSSVSPIRTSLSAGNASRETPRKTTRAGCSRSASGFGALARPASAGCHKAAANRPFASNSRASRCPVSKSGANREAAEMVTSPTKVIARAATRYRVGPDRSPGESTTRAAAANNSTSPNG